MSIAIMQPYLFPYIGYFQLVYASDTFVFYDDVHFIKHGWINRNKILLNGKEQLITISCKDSSQNKLIKDIEVLYDPKGLQKVLHTIQVAYKKAPYFDQVFPVIEEVFNVKEGTTIAEMAMHSIQDVCKYLGLQKHFKTSSKEYTNQELKKADRLIDICHLEGQQHYINASGGIELYTKEQFKERGIDISFLITQAHGYAQFKNEFIPSLSIIDILMFNDIDTIVSKMLPDYHIE